MDPEAIDISNIVGKLQDDVDGEFLAVAGSGLTLAVLFWGLPRAVRLFKGLAK